MAFPVRVHEDPKPCFKGHLGFQEQFPGGPNRKFSGLKAAERFYSLPSHPCISHARFALDQGLRGFAGVGLLIA
jgi:hypothetical protein